MIELDSLSAMGKISVKPILESKGKNSIDIDWSYEVKEFVTETFRHYFPGVNEFMIIPTNSFIYKIYRTSFNKVLQWFINIFLLFTFYFIQNPNWVIWEFKFPGFVVVILDIVYN